MADVGPPPAPEPLAIEKLHVLDESPLSAAAAAAGRPAAAVFEHLMEGSRLATDLAAASSSFAAAGSSYTGWSSPSAASDCNSAGAGAG